MNPADRLHWYDTTNVRVVDGDTIDADLRLGFGVTFTVSFRLYGINAPEHTTAAGRAALAWLHDQIDGHRVIIRSAVNTRGADKQEKYGRWLATVYVDGVNLNEALVAAGHAKPWDGHGPRPVEHTPEETP